MKFLLVRKQKGTGCGYTIACGTSARVIKGESREAMISALRSDTLADGDDYGLRDDLCSVFLYDIPDEDQELPFWDWLHEKKEAEKENERLLAEDKEREELARLQKKYGPKT